MLIISKRPLQQQKGELCNLSLSWYCEACFFRDAFFVYEIKTSEELVNFARTTRQEGMNIVKISSKYTVTPQGNDCPIFYCLVKIDDPNVFRFL